MSAPEPRLSLSSRLVWRLLDRLYEMKGWQLQGRAPDARKYVVLGVPHSVRNESSESPSSTVAWQEPGGGNVNARSTSASLIVWLPCRNSRVQFSVDGNDRIEP